MKRRLMIALSVCLYAIAALFLYKGITVTSGGSFLDFSGLARIILCGLSVVMIIGATCAWRTKDPKGKKLNTIVMIALVVLVVACAYAGTMLLNPPATEYVSINLPFEVEDVECVEMYHYEGSPENAQKKVVTEHQSVLYLYTTFEECMLQEKAFEKPADASITCFRFVLDDDTCFELIYHGYGIKKGYLQSPTEGFTYFTPADIGWNWDMLDSTLTAVPAEEKEIPTMD